MTNIQRFSSRRQRLDHAFLNEKLKGARSYKRIAGYFRSSIFELVGEEIAAIPEVRIVCNSELDAADVAVSKLVRETALKERWNEAPSEVEGLLHRDRYRRLHELLTRGNVEIRVVPKDRVFIHGKAGVIEGGDGVSVDQNGRGQIDKPDILTQKRANQFIDEPGIDHALLLTLSKSGLMRLWRLSSIRSLRSIE